MTIEHILILAFFIVIGASGLAAIQDGLLRCWRSLRRPISPLEKHTGLNRSALLSRQ